MPPGTASTPAATLRSAWDLRVPPPTRSAAIVAAAFLVVLAVLLGQAHGGADSPAWALPLDVVVGVAGAFSLRAALRRPFVAALVFVGLSAAFPPATPLAGTALLWLAQNAEVRVSVTVGALAVTAQLVRGLWRTPDGGLFGWWLAAVVAGFAAVVGWGAWTRARRQVVESLLERARQAEFDQASRLAEARRTERQRIAREMHDVLAHRLSLLATYAGAIEYNRDAPPDRLVEAAQVIRSGAHEALADLRQVIDVLRAEETPSDGGTGPPQPNLDRLPDLVDESRRAGVSVDLQLLETADPRPVPVAIGRTAYRIVQEALTNARKHAPGQPVEVVVEGSPGEGLILEVRNPFGDTAADSAPGSGTGLVGMAERVRLAGGEFEAGPDASGGFRVRASLPWPQ